MPNPKLACLHIFCTFRLLSQCISQFCIYFLNAFLSSVFAFLTLTGKIAAASREALSTPQISEQNLFLSQVKVP